ncbi:pentapeptide repeat-containing protein [Dactylosporangium sp. NPDC000521]|uniref:pentapeptide repeat-containing protein n=1 Tax=Dactylosporangium sp. NPDC000521 TaxID=3363975 RepID=UPI0036B0CAD4
MTALPPAEATARVDALRAGTALTELQAARLSAIVRLLDDNGRFVLRAALDAAEFPGDPARGQDAFQDFRKRVNDAAERSGVDLRLELEARKSAPERRHGWFAGGDLINEGIAAFTERAADDTGIAHPIAPEVTELGESRRTRVYVSVAADQAASRSTRQLVSMLGQHLQLDGDRRWEIADPDSVGLGEDVRDTRDRLCAQADVRVVLLSPSYLTDAANAAERGRVLDLPGRRVVFALTGLPDGTPTLGPLRRRDVYRRDQPWAGLRGDQQRKQYVDNLVDALHAELSASEKPAPDGTSELAEHTKRLTDRRGGNDSTVLVDAEVSETTFRESHLEAPDRGPALAAVNRLLEWATAKDGPQLCALLGDVGLGKTTTAKLFARALLDQRANGAPLPLLFDLRDVRATDLTRAITLDAILDSMLEASRPAAVPRERLSADTVRRRLTQGDAVVIFDGLDEALVHLAPHDQRLFIRQLWRAVEGTTSTRMLLTCRTQYFRTIRDEVNFFTGDGRQGPQGKDYLALLMLPFGERQIRDYLAANLSAPPDKVEAFLTLIGTVHDLTDLARRPMTLKLISDQVELIETAKLQGREVRAVDLYGEVVERWLARDSGKHTLLPDHKHLLMEAIAAEIWRSGRNSWTAADVDDWLLDLLDQRPDLRRHYRDNVPDLWKTDFRTATFLSRDGDEFAFAHRSLFEYFLARHLFRVLCEVPAAGPGPVAMPVPSPETLGFLGQCLATATPSALAAVVAGLAAIRDHYTPQASELAFAYALHAADSGHPHQSLARVQLPGADLAEWAIGSPDADGYTLSLTGANLRGADLRRARIHHTDLAGADLTDARLDSAELHDSRLNQARLDRTLIVATLLRRCGIDGVDFRQAVRHRTTLLWCTPPPEPIEDLLLAPLLPSEQSRLSGITTPRVATGHTGSVNAVAWSPDGTRLATGSGDRSVRVWDAVTGIQQVQLAGHTDWVRSVVWSPDGTRVATGSDDRSVRVWDAMSGAEELRLSGHDSWVNAVAWSPDGTRLATGSGDRSVRVWDAVSGAEERRFSDHGSWVNAVAWSPDGLRLASAGDDRSVQVWDAVTGAEELRLVGHADWVRSVAWSPDGTRLATGSDDSSVRVWDAVTGAEELRFSGHDSPVNAVVWSPDGTRVATGSDDRGVRVWDAVSGAEELRFSGHDSWVSAVAWSPDGTRLATGGGDRSVRVWDAVSGAEELRFSGHITSVLAVAWSPDGTRLASAGDDRGVRVWDAVTGAEELRLVGHADWVRSVAWSPDNTRLATGSDDQSVRVWDAVTGAEELRLVGHADWVRSVVWSPDGTRVATGSDDCSVRVWDAVTGAEELRFSGHDSPVNAVAWSPDGTRLASAGDDRGVRVWDAVTGAEELRFSGHDSWVSAVAWSPDGTRLATGGRDSHVRVWDAVTGAEEPRLSGHTGWVRSVVWSPDGTHVATGSDDSSVRVWDAATGAESRQLSGHTSSAHSVAWSPDGTHLATGGDDGALRIWDARSGRAARFVVYGFAEDQAAVFDAASGQLIGASPEAWRRIFWSFDDDRWPDGMPAEVFGELPPLPRAR